MKRKTKNIIIITLIIILGIASGFTVKLAKDSVSTNSENIGQNMGMPPSQGGLGQNNNNEAGTEQSNGSMGQKQGTPPAKPDGSNNNNLSEPPAMLSGNEQSSSSTDNNNNGSMGEPPTKPDDSNGNSTSKIKLTGNSYVTSLEDEDSTYSNIDFNGYKLYVNGVAIN